MSAYEGLRLAQSALEKRGVRDVKFFFRLSLPETPRSEVSNGVAGFLDAYIKGRHKVLEKIGDSSRN